MKVWSPFGHSPDYKPKLPSRWTCLIGDIDHGYTEVSWVIWANIVLASWFIPIAYFTQLWTTYPCSTSTVGECTKLTASGWLFAEVWGLALIGGYAVALAVLGFGRRKDR